MLGLSAKTEKGQTFNISKLLREMNAAKDVRNEAKTVESVVMTNAVNKYTMNLNGPSEIKEIYVICVSLLEKKTPLKFIETFDMIIHFHTVFVLNFDEEYALCVAPKSCTRESVKVGKYYVTPWANEEPKIEFRFGVENMTDIYFAVFEKILVLTKRQGESLKGYITRYDDIRHLKVDIDRQQKKVDKEIQPRTRFEYNDELKKMKYRLKDLEGE